MKAAGDPRLAAERSLVGVAMSSTDTALAVAELIQPRDLALGAHQIILETIIDLLGEGHQVTPNTVIAELSKTGKVTQAGGASYLHTLLEQAALPSQISYYAKQVKTQAWKRSLAIFATRCSQLAETGDTPPEADLEQLGSWLDELTTGTAESSTVRAADLVHTVLDEIERGADADAVETGYLDLDAGLSVRPGQLIVVGARPGIGKTTFGMDVARHVGNRLQQPVYFLSLEMSRNELMKRMISAEARVPLHSILHHRADKPLLTDGDWVRIAKATELIGQSGIVIDDTPGAGLAHIRARLRHMQRHGGVRLAVIDYLGILATPGRQENRQQAVAELTRGLKLLAREIGIPIFLLAQLNRQVEGRSDRRPVPSDLKDSGAIEADADVVILLHREDAYDRESPRAGEIDLIVDKSRHGPQFTATAAFQGHYCRIVNMATGPDPSPATKGHLRPVS